MKRKITKDLIDWKNNEFHKPLLICGARQIGKTYSVVEFAKENYENIVYINFAIELRLRELFKTSVNPVELLPLISSQIKDCNFVEHKTIIIFDEIQLCPNARASLKFFHLDGKFDIIATGSLLGLDNYLTDIAHLPTGYEDIITMHSMDFEEFLWAKGLNNSLLDVVKDSLKNKTKIPPPINDQLLQLLQQYIVVGGYPDIVKKFIATNDLNLVHTSYQTLIKEYKGDMIKYSDQVHKTLITDCFDSLPSQLTKENKKFKYSIIAPKASKRKYEGSIRWLEDFGVITKCYKLKTMQFPFIGNKTDSFKVYFNDIGLLTATFGPDTKRDIMNNNIGIYKGAIIENLIADIFIKSKRPLYYFSSPSGLEIDFVIRHKDKPCLLEVKSKDGNAKAMKTVLNNYPKYGIDQGIKLGQKNYGESGQFLTLPLYCAFLLDYIS